MDFVYIDVNSGILILRCSKIENIVPPASFLHRAFFTLANKNRATS